MEINEQSLMNALGLESENTQQVAAAAAGSENIGGNVQKVAEPAAQTDDATADTGAGTEADGVTVDNAAGSTGNNTELTPEQRRENAAKRRRQEQQAAIDQAVEIALQAEREKHPKEMAGFFTGAKLKNTITGEPINSMEDYRKWLDDFQQAQFNRELQDGKVSAETLNRVIEQNPAVRKANELLTREQQLSQEADRKAAEEAQKQIDADIARIHEEDASISTMADLLSAPNSKQIYEYVRKGNNVYDAWYLANRERMKTATQQAAAEAAYQKQTGKAHLTPVGNTRGGGAMSVPHEELELFRQFMPDVSDAEITKYYNDYKKQ